MEYIARINPVYFAAMHCFAATSDPRHYLNGISIEPHPETGVIIMATDGHHMGVIHDPDGWAAGRIVVGDVSRQLINACKGKLPSRSKIPRRDKLPVKKNKKRFTPALPPQRLWISGTGALLDWNGAGSEPPVSPFDASVVFADRISLIDSKPVKWRKVLPAIREAPTEMPLVNLSLISSVYEAATVLGHGDHFAAACRLDVADGKIIARLIDSSISDRFVAIVMPMRDGPRGDLLPAALTPKQKPRLQFSSNGSLVDIAEPASQAEPAAERQ
jgi:hypothetical protein